MKKYIKSDFGSGGQDRGYERVGTRNWTISPTKFLRKINNYYRNLLTNSDKKDIKDLEDDITRYTRMSIQEAELLRDRLDKYLAGLYTFQKSNHTSIDVEKLRNDIDKSNI